VDEEPYVLLCECRNVGELHLVRAALQAHDVPLRVEGEAIHGVLGAIYGAAQMPRISVPPKWLQRAREIATEVVGPFDDAPPEPEDDAPGSPFREGAAEPDDAPDDEGPLERPKMHGVPLLLAMLGLALGLGHIYARRMRTGLMLLAIAAIGGTAMLVGQPWGIGLIVAVELFDLVGALVAVTMYNRALRARAERTPPLA
jgi:hypothetical protein